MATFATSFERFLDPKAWFYDASMIDVQDAGTILDEGQGVEADGSGLGEKPPPRFRGVPLILRSRAL